MKRSLLITLSVTLMASCSTVKQSQRRAAKCQKWGVCQAVQDCTVVTETVRTDTIILDDSQMWLDMLFECDSSGQVFARELVNLQTENTNLKLQLKDGRLVVYVNKPNDTIMVHSVDKIRVQKIIQTQKVNELTQWQVIQMWGGRLLALIVLLALIYWFIQARINRMNKKLRI